MRQVLCAQQGTWVHLKIVTMLSGQLAITTTPTTACLRLLCISDFANVSGPLCTAELTLAHRTIAECSSVKLQWQQHLARHA